MSSPELTHPLRRAAGAAIAALVVVAGLTACTTTGIRPLYGSTAGGETREALRRVDVVAPGRIGQQIRNDLVFGFGDGAGEPEKPRWRLEITVTMIDTAVGLDRGSNLANAHLGQVSAGWVLSEIATDRTLASGTSFANAAYDYSQQRFADLRAKRDAENRAAGSIAVDIRTKIAVWFAEHPTP